MSKKTIDIGKDAIDVSGPIIPIKRTMITAKKPVPKLSWIALFLSLVLKKKAPIIIGAKTSPKRSKG